MAEKIPRRMKRFQRTKRKKPEKKVVEKLKGIPKKRQKNFTEKLKIEKESPDEIAETIFEQLKRKDIEQKQKEKDKKRKVGKKDSGKKEEKKIPSGKQDEKTKEEIPLWKKRRKQRLNGKTPEKSPELTEQKQIFEKNLNKTEEKEKPKRIHGRKGKQKAEVEEETKVDLSELKGTKISGLFGNSKKTKQGLGKKEIDELKLDLSEMDDLEKGNKGEEILELDEKEKEEIFESDDLKEGTGKKGTCINCKQKFNELIFCSKCGNAFCDKCAKIKHKEGTKTKYVCPHCGKVTKK